MHEMVSFSPEDVIFLLNKWDTISHEDDDQLEKFIEDTKNVCINGGEKQMIRAFLGFLQARYLVYYLSVETNTHAEKKILQIHSTYQANIFIA